MNLPPYGLCCPCKFVKLLEADRIVVRVCKGNRAGGETETWTIQLPRDELTVPPPDTPQGRAAADFSEQVLDDFSDSLSVFIPDPFQTFNRFHLCHLLTGMIFLGTEQRLSEALAYAGHASFMQQTKQPGEGHGEPTETARR